MCTEPGAQTYQTAIDARCRSMGVFRIQAHMHSDYQRNILSFAIASMQVLNKKEFAKL